MIQKITHAPDGSVTWTTQTASPEQAQRAASNLLANSCPVALQARQTAEAFRREVGDGGVNPGGTYPKGVAQHLHLTATDPQARQIVAANITVLGFSDKPRALATGPAPDSPNASRPMEVRFASDPGLQAAADLTVPGLSAVTAIDLNSVTYSDGSTWKLAAGSVCRSPIDGFMLIGNR